MDIAAIGMLRALDLAGTCVFALSGAALAVRARMDLFGVLVLAIVTAVSGGIIRDLAAQFTSSAMAYSTVYIIEVVLLLLTVLIMNPLVKTKP